MEAATGVVLFEKNADQPMAPASMSKLMTAYMVFERLRNGRLSLDDTFSVSETAWRKGGAKSGSSTMFLEPGTRVRAEDLLRGSVEATRRAITTGTAGEAREAAKQFLVGLSG